MVYGAGFEHGSTICPRAFEI